MNLFKIISTSVVYVYTVALNSRFRTLSNWTIFTMQEAMEWTSSLQDARKSSKISGTNTGLSMKGSESLFNYLHITPIGDIQNP